MKNQRNLKQYVVPAVDEIVNGSNDFVREELVNREEKYEIQLSKGDQEVWTQLLLTVEDPGRPVPRVTVNATSELGENLFYRSQNIDRSRKVIINVKEALREMIRKLKSG